MEGSLLRVTIPQYEEIEEGRVAFMVSVHYAKLSWQVWRRFSDFAALHEQLLASDYAALPELPPKTLLPAATDTKFLERRKNKLFNYIQELLRRPDTRMSQELLTFLSLTEQAAVHSKCVRPVMTATTGSQRFAVSSLDKGGLCIAAAYEDKTSMSRLGRLWTIVEPDELGMVALWFLDTSTKLFSSTYSQKLPHKARAVLFNEESKVVVLALDDGTLQSLQLQSSGNLKQIASVEIHRSAVVGLSGFKQGQKFLSAAADGSIRLVEAPSLSVISGGKLEKRLGGHSLTCCSFVAELLLAFIGTSAGVVIVYSLETKTPRFQAESRLIPEDSISCILSDSLEVFVGHGPHVSVLKYQRDRLERGAVLQIRDNAETVHSMALNKPGKRLFVGYASFIAWWCLERGECLLAWAAHNGGVHQLLMQEGGDSLISGGDSGTIKLWQLPPASALTPWNVHTPQQQFDTGDCCMRPAGEKTAFIATDVGEEQLNHQHLQQHQQRQQHQQQPPQQLYAAAMHEDWTAAGHNRSRGPVLLRRCSSDSEEDLPQQQHQQQPPPQQQQQQQQQQQEEEPPLLVQHEESSTDEELDDLRSALA